MEAHLEPAEAAARCSEAARRAVRSMVRAAHAVQREQDPESGSACLSRVAPPGLAAAARLRRRYSSFTRARLQSPAVERERARCAAAGRFGPPRSRACA